MKKRVLFLCTGNSARSQIAEGILRKIAGDRYEVFSAGTHPKGVHPLSIEVMREIDIDISGQTSKDVSVFQGHQFDYVITVCDRAKQACPVFPVPPRFIGDSMIQQRLEVSTPSKPSSVFETRLAPGSDYSFG